MENKDLKLIKKNYGEKMMHMCREMFPRILEKEGALSEIMETHFAKNKHLAEDIENEDKREEFKNFIFSFFDVEKVPIQNITQESAIQLLKRAGYTLYPECKTEKDIQPFKKWWTKDEELCTFVGNRLLTCRVWFAVKDNAENLKREDFPIPSRQDEYGTSVISIQFSRSDSQSLSIKNRYNHTVNNPDNTFNSNLDNIIYGLTDAFERDYGVKDKIGIKKTDFELTNYVCAKGKNYHYNYEVFGRYYCDNNIILDNFNEIKLPSHQMLIDTYIIDFKEKTINNFETIFNKDCFPKTIGEIENITFNGELVKFSVKNGKDVEVRVDERNRIISYKNENLTICGDDFMFSNRLLAEIETPNLIVCGDKFLYSNVNIDNLNLKNLTKSGDYFLQLNSKINKVDLPKLQEVGSFFLNTAEFVNELNLPNLKNCGHYFMTNYQQPKELKLLNLKKCGYYFMANYQQSKEINLPNLEYSDGAFLYYNKSLKSISLPKLKECGEGFLFNNKSLTKLSLPSLERVGARFLWNNNVLENLYLPNLKEIDGNQNINFNKQECDDVKELDL